MRQCKLGVLATILGLSVIGCDRNGPPPAQTGGTDGAPQPAIQAAQPANTTLTPASRLNEQQNTGTTAQQDSAAAQESAGSDKANTATKASGSAEASPTRTPDVIFVPTPQPVVDKMLEIAKVKKGEVVYDLGCGDGRIVVTAAKKYGVKAYGFDIDPVRVAEAKENVKKNGVENLVTIEQKDIFTLDLSPANVVTLYLLPRLNVKLIPQLEKLKPGSRIVSHDFDMAGVRPAQHLQVGAEDRKHDVYLWNVPLQKEATTSVSP